MSETTINQRLKFLLSELGMKAGAFARALDLSETTIRNYVDRTAKPSSDVLERISNTFRQVNLVWLITGQGEPLTDKVPQVTNTATTRIKNVSGGAVNSGTGNQLITLEACQQELELTKRSVTDLQKEVQSLRDQLARADALAAAKEEMLTLLRSGFTRPN